ncbi:MAG: sugar ABC transporter permease [Dehalococcoidales bacterium]|nr:sugar ABC transporter permease [Dehalococcoidales bacterium]
MLRDVPGAETTPATGHITPTGRVIDALRSEFNREESRTAWLFATPALVYFCIFTGFPVVYGLYLSLYDWRLTASSGTFIGAENYRELLSSPSFLTAVVNTGYFTAGLMSCVIVFSFLAATVLNQPIRKITVLRGVFYSPAVTSVVAISIVWLWILDPEYGLINKSLLLLGIDGPRWLADSRWALPGLVLTAAWRSIGYFAVVYLAGLQGIDQTYYEAASIDGANWFGRFRHITVPLLMPTTFFVVVMSVIWSFQVFPLIYVMTKGGPAGSTSVIVFYLYEQAFIHFRLGYASAVAYVLFAILFFFTVVQFRFLGKHTEV